MDRPDSHGRAGDRISATRGTVDLVGHAIVPVKELDSSLGVSFQNIVIKATTDKGEWIEALTLRIGDWRALFRSTYFQWALAINGLYVAAERYGSAEWQNHEKAFTIGGLQADKTGRISRALLAQWPGDRAAKAHLDTAPKMCAWGFIELYSCFEGFVFDLYRTYCAHHPDDLLRGAEYRHLRRLRSEAQADPAKQEAWQTALRERLDQWQRKKLYDGLDRVFLAMFNTTGLKKPKHCTRTTLETWAESLGGIGLVRHLLVHGVNTVPKELGDFCKQPNGVALDFQEGAPLKVELRHLQCAELFSDQLLNAINLSLVEHSDAGA
jgi:hypothetical protein